MFAAFSETTWTLKNCIVYLENIINHSLARTGIFNWSRNKLKSVFVFFFVEAPFNGVLRDKRRQGWRDIQKLEGLLLMLSASRSLPQMGQCQQYKESISGQTTKTQFTNGIQIKIPSELDGGWNRHHRRPYLFIYETDYFEIMLREESHLPSVFTHGSVVVGSFLVFFPFKDKS